MVSIEVSGRLIGDDNPCFLIAEAGVNHNGELGLAYKLIDAAVKVGADAVKFQTFNAENMVTAGAKKADYQLQTTSSAESQLDMLKKLELPSNGYSKLSEYCKTKRIIFLSSPFDEGSADLLDNLEVPAFKIPSGEITNTPLLRHIARKGRPLLVSTGMSNMDEVELAFKCIENEGNSEIALFHCVSNYPAESRYVNLRAMAIMKDCFNAPIGYSDHTLGIEIPIAAAALGAKLIEKHITLDRDMSGPDQRASLEPQEFGEMVRSIRSVESALGHGRKEPADAELEIAEVARKSLVASVDIPSGTILENYHLAIKRPGTGIPPYNLHKALGRMTVKDVNAGMLITGDMIEEFDI